MSRTSVGDLIKSGQIFINNELRAPLNSRERSGMSGAFPYYGATGVMDRINDFRFDGSYVLVAEDGTVFGENGISPMIQYVSDKFWVSNHAHVLSGAGEKETKYLKLALEASDVRPYITGAVQPKLSKNNLLKLPIYWPSSKRRNEILDVINPLDEKIELNRRMNETLEQIGQALFHHYFIDNPDSVLWDTVKVGDVLSDLQSGSRPKGGALEEGVPSIGAENINGLGKYDYSKEKFISSEFFNNLKRGVVKNEDVLLYKDGAYVGKKALFMDDFPHKKCAINEHVFILRTNKKINSQFYLYFWLDQSSITKKIIDSGVKAAQPGINQSNVNNLPILLPPERLVSEFDDTIRPLMKRIFANAIENNKLASARDSLLPKLISGEAEV